MSHTNIKKRDYQNLFDHHPMARFILNVHDDGTFSYAHNNHAAERFFGFKAQDINGHALTKIFNEKMAQDILKACKKCVRYQNPVTVQTMPLYPGIVEEKTFILNPIFNEDGQIYLIDMLATDTMADMTKLQLERDTALRFMAAIFDSSHLGILVTDKNDQVLRVNDAFLKNYNYTRNDLVGRKFTKIFAHKKQHIINKQDDVQREEWCITGRRGKSAKNVIVTTAKLDLKPTRPIFIHTFVNITDHKNTEESLRQQKLQSDKQNRAKSEFLANMSHELRTPLNAIIGFSEMICDEVFGPIGNDKYQEYLADIRFSAQHLLDIINDVLDLSKIEAGKFDLIEKELDLYAVFDAVIRITLESAEAKGITLQTNIDHDVCQLYADNRVLRQMLLNLVSNAIKFSSNGDTITFNAHLNNNEGIDISVIDTGKGIAVKDMNRILEPFQQICPINTDETMTNGTGLGLSLTNAMAKMHQGSISIKSTLGHGTNVTIHLPKERIIAMRNEIQEIAS